MFSNKSLFVGVIGNMVYVGFLLTACCRMKMYLFESRKLGPGTVIQ